MRNTFTFFVLVVAALFAFTPAQAQTAGGPDLFGYEWRDSNDPNGPAYSWIDITSNPNAVQISGITDDNSVGPFPMGFDFRYYWIDVNEFKFGSNGWIGLGAQGNIGNIAHCFPIIPSQGGAGETVSDVTDVALSTKTDPTRRQRGTGPTIPTP